MTAITKGAIKAVKFYKHVVQSVEKFLQKVCWLVKLSVRMGIHIFFAILVSSRVQDPWPLCD